MSSDDRDGNPDSLRAELERFRRLEALYNATEQLALIGHFEWDYASDRLLSCSQQYASLFGMDVDAVIEDQDGWEKLLQWVHPDDHARYRDAHERLLRKRELEEQYRIVSGDGAVRHIRESSVLTVDDEGRATGWFGILQDVTQQVKHERDLEYRDELARQAESITDIGHFIYDEESERYVYMSAGCARIFGSTPEAYVARVDSFEQDLADIVVEDRARVEEEYRSYRRSGEDCAIEYRIRRADGSIRWVRELSKAKIIHNGRVRQTLGVMCDITQRVQREQELVFKDALANQAEEITDIGYFLFDERQDCHLFVSPGQARIVGLDVDEYMKKVVSNEDYINLVYEPDRDILRRAYYEDIDRVGGWNVEYRLLRPDGELRWIREIGQSLKVDARGVEQTIGVLQDVTEQKQAEQELVFRDAMANQAEAITEIGHFVYDEIRQEYLFASPGLARIHGLSEIELTRSKISWDGDMKLIHPEDRAHVRKAYDDFLVNGGDWQVDYRLIRGDGEIRWVREMGKAHVMNHGIPEQTIGVLQDITAQKQAEQEIIEARDTLEQQVIERTRELANTVKQLQDEVKEREKIAAELDFLANHDALTGLPSLRLCKDRLDQSLAEARRNRQTSAVMFLDLDGFKEINDEHGHEVGDLVLKVIADRIKAEIRETDTVARIGGDEFVIILSSLPDLAISERIAGNLIEQVAQPIQIEQIHLGVSSSIGIALYPDNGTTAEQLIRAADKAMYQVKRAGKNAYGFAERERRYEVVGGKDHKPVEG
ncbi:MAG: PAS domain-containing protein [Gammaproteobacteria bacterium]|nr:PAS domain-containing protein [Gammaproteobacteria bacterium]